MYLEKTNIEGLKVETLILSIICRNLYPKKECVKYPGSEEYPYTVCIKPILDRTRLIEIIELHL